MVCEKSYDWCENGWRNMGPQCSYLTNNLVWALSIQASIVKRQYCTFHLNILRNMEIIIKISYAGCVERHWRTMQCKYEYRNCCGRLWGAHAPTSSIDTTAGADFAADIGWHCIHFRGSSPKYFTISERMEAETAQGSFCRPRQNEEQAALYTHHQPFPVTAHLQNWYSSEPSYYHYSTWSNSWFNAYLHIIKWKYFEGLSISHPLHVQTHSQMAN